MGIRILVWLALSLTVLGGASPLAEAVAAAAAATSDPEIRFLGDEGHIVVMAHDGSSYDRTAPDGTIHADPRQRIARELIATHGDFYDFIVVFTNFDFERDGASGSYLGVRNDVEGIGRPLVDNGAAFGSARTLQGYVDMGPVTQYRGGAFSLTPTDPRFRATLGILAHEIGHRWLADVRYEDGGELKSDLLGRDGVHWSFLLSSDASFLYGNRWEPVAGSAPNLYRSTETQARFSDLDLYLMGFLPPDDVPPVTLLVNPAVDPARLPERGAEVEALEVESIDISQIIAAEGPRSPTHEASQKELNVAFVLLTAPDLLPSSTDLEAIEGVRAAFTESFFALTRGRALVDPDLFDVAPPVPGAEPDTSLGLAWLLSHQRPDGRFEAHPMTAVRDTATAVAALGTMGVRGPPLDGARAFLSSGSPASVDFLARAITAGAEIPVTRLESLRNDDGAYGIFPGYRSDPLDTALALQALVIAQSPTSAELSTRLVAMQLPDGSWSSIEGGAGDTLTTSEALHALELADASDAAIQSAVAWLVSRQQTDGGFGDGPSTSYATARVLEALLNAMAPRAAVDRAVDYLKQTQRPDGSWNGSVFETASVLRAVVPSTLPNLVIDVPDVRLEPDPPEVGETVAVEITVRNRSRVPAGPFDVQLFDGDPELGAEPIGAPIVLAGLGAGESAAVGLDWDTSGLEGAHTLVAIADFAAALTEITKEDNVAARDVDVLPPLPNLVSLLTVDPPSPIEGTNAVVTAAVENRGTAPSTPTTLELFREVPRLGVSIGAEAIPALAPGDTHEASFLWSTAGLLGSHRLHALVDGDDVVRERFESDNEAALAVDVRPPPPQDPDLEILSFTLTPDELASLPQEMVATARIANTGLDPVPGATVTLYLGNPASGGVAVSSQSLVFAGDSVFDFEIPFSVTTGGTRTYYLAADAGATSERDLTNNLASAVLRDRMDVIDVTLVPGSIQLSATSLVPGDLLSVDVTIRNSGTRSLSSVPVALLYEVGAGGERRRASTVNVPLAPGESRLVTLTWRANRTGTVPIELRADPDDDLIESREDDNVLTTSVDVASSVLPNLTLLASDIEASPTVLAEGLPATLTAVVRNVGDSDAPAFAVRFFTEDATIGVADVAGLGAGSTLEVSVAWSPVQARGTTLVHVALDPDDAIEEIDESDNEVFRVLDVDGLPDLLAASGELRMTPAFPRSGEGVAIEASFRNAGGQPSRPAAVELRLDDPASGALIASEEVGALAPGESFTLDASWDSTGVEGEHALYLVLDVRDDVVEQQEGNNVVRLPVALQDGDDFVTPLYFSPNGDGIQDEAVFFFRTSDAASVEVHDPVLGRVRVLAPAGDANGSATWDGRDGRGVVAPDGEYFFVLFVDDREVLRRRVVLDTNRSPLVEALGTEMLAFNQLTCAAPRIFEAPAWAPDDSAVYVIVGREDVDAPDFPVGLYRAANDGSALTLIVADEAFSEIELVGSAVRFGERRRQAVAATGEHALVRSFDEGLQVVDLVSGVLRTIDPDPFANAIWTSDGQRLLLASASGLFFVDPDGNVLQTLVSGSVEAALLTPDDLTVVYRRSDELVLRTSGADGTGDRILAATDAREAFGDGVEPLFVELEELYYLRSKDRFVFTWTYQVAEESVGPFLLDRDADVVEEAPFLSELSSDERWELRSLSGIQTARRVGGREARPILPSSGNFDFHWSYRDTQVTYLGDGGDGCVDRGLWTARSLLNGEADFRLTQLPSRFGVRITGTASDQNLDTYLLEFAPAGSPTSPTSFAPIQPPSRDPVVADTFTTWLPPAPGDYFVRLTVRDRAGNESVHLDRILWNETPPIASLRRAPAYLSPNGDGAGDVLLVEYDVLTPTNLVFHVRDAEGRSVRAIPRDEPAPGLASFTWDGTDDVGAPVPDGKYVLELEGAEIPIFVDATPPEVSASYSELYTYGADPDDPELAVDIEGTIGDDNLEAWELVDQSGVVIQASPREIADGIVVERLEPRQGLDLRARDRAGNETVVPLAGPSRELRVIRAFGATPVVGPTSPGEAEPVPPQFLSPRAGLSLQARSSFAGAIRFLYQADGDPSVIDIPTLGNGNVSFRAEDLALGTRYVGRFESDGIASQEIAFTVGPEAIFLAGEIAGSPAEVRLRFANTVSVSLVEGKLLRTSAGVTELLRSYAPVPAGDALLDAAPPCSTSVHYLLEATDATGAIYRSTTELHYPNPAPLLLTAAPCSSVDDAAIESPSSVEAPLPKTATAIVQRDGLADPVERWSLLLDGAEVGSVSGADLLAGGNLRIPFDVSAVPEGQHNLTARATLSGGGTIGTDYGLSFFLDQSVPEASILAPAEGGNVCVATVDGRETVTFDVLVRDHRIEGARLEVLHEGGWVPLAPVAPLGLPASGELQRTLPVIVPPGLEGATAFRLLATSARISGESAGRPAPPPPRWPRLDNNGTLSAEVTRNVVVSRPLGLDPLTTTPSFPALFSPNGDAVADTMVVSGEAREAVSLTIRVLTASEPRALLRTLLAGESRGAGLFAAAWDGRDDRGIVVPDGEYVVEAEASNGCGAISIAATRVHVDTTAPTVSIDNLAADQPVSIGTEVIGTATDPNFGHYLLDYGEGVSPTSFVEIASPVSRRVESGPLGFWSVGGIPPGTTTLRLTAADEVGNTSVATVVVDVQSSDFIAALGAEPALFSPNGDGVKDTTTVGFELLSDARVTLTVRDAGDAPVATLVSGDLTAAGPDGRVWDGLGLPEGAYTVLLRAEDPANAALFEEARFAVTVDTEAPSFSITSPSTGGFLPRPGIVSGAVDDPNLESYRVEVGPAAGVLNVVASDSAPASGALATLRLEDGSYQLRATASDRAGNVVELTRAFGVDGTPPKLALSVPENGSYLGPSPSSLAVEGSLVEPNLADYELSLGFGASPSTFVPLAGGPGPGLANSHGPLGTWDLAGLPDGSYTLRLTATDEATNVSVVESRVTLDTTVPTVTSSAPGSGQVISGAVTFEGVLADDHFAEGRLLIAPGAAPAQLTEVAFFDGPASGVLIDGLALVDGPYVLELRAVDRSGNVASSTTSFVVDSEPPEAPSGLQSTVSGRDVALHWTTSVSSDVVGYHVERDGVRITATPVAGTSFLDANRPEGRYAYRVLSVDGAALESDPEGPVSAVVDLTPPVVALRAPDDGDRVRVQVEVLGTAFSERDFAEYRLEVASAASPQNRVPIARGTIPVTFDILGRWQPISEGDYILSLEAEDTSGNTAVDRVRVTVDNSPPAPPVLLSVSASDPDSDDVEVEWEASSSDDVAGYLVFRNGAVANAPGNVSGSLEPFLLPGPLYVDPDLPDGEHCYRVAAMDLAGNVGSESNELCAFLDNREPSALIVEPVAGERFDTSRLVRAVVEDLDVASVAFEYQPLGEALWSGIGVDTEAPFELLWDITGLAFGDYRLRAVATDIGTRQDSSPSVVEVVLGDATPPETPGELEAVVRGADVSLSWLPVPDADLEAYRILRDGALASSVSAGMTTATDAGVPDGEHVYAVVAVDEDGNESAPSNEVDVTVYAPVLLPPFPVYESALVTLPGKGATPDSDVTLYLAGTSSAVAATTADTSGGYRFEDLALSVGPYMLEAEAVDGAGHVSRRSEVAVLVRNVPPATPSGFTATANGDTAELAWDANLEADLSGYVATRDGDVLTPRGRVRPAGPIATGLAATTNATSARAADAIDDRTFTYWSVGSADEVWLDVALDVPRHVEAVRIRWGFDRQASDFDLFVELEGRLAPIARVRGNTETTTFHPLPFAVQTTRVRLLSLGGATSFGVWVAELELEGIAPETDTAFTDTPPAPGVYAYGVAAMDRFGGKSEEAGPLERAMGDLTSPEPPTALLATAVNEDVFLQWTASVSPDVSTYRVYRDGALIRTTSSTSATDPNLSNGVYGYAVRAVDTAGNEGAPSASAAAVVDVDPPSAPALTVTSLPVGGTLELDWTTSSGPLGVSSYVVGRSSAAGGTYADIAQLGAATRIYVDSGLDNGVEQFYVVRAVDFRGQASAPSNEVSATPSDESAPAAPFWLAPPVPEAPLVVSRSRQTLLGGAEPGSLVEVSREGVSIGIARASESFAPTYQTFLRSSSNLVGRLAFSPDGAVVAEVGLFGSSFDTEIVLHDRRTGEERTVPYDGQRTFERGSVFSPDGTRLAVATTIGSDVPFALRVVDLEAGTTAVHATSAAPQLPVFISDTEVVLVVGPELQRVDIGSGVAATLHTSSGFVPSKLTASRDGTYVAWSEGSKLYVMPSTGGAPELVLDNFNLDGFAWAGERLLAITRFDTGLGFYDALSATTTVVPGTIGMTRPLALPSEGVISAFVGTKLFWVFTDGAILGLGESPFVSSPEAMGWSSELVLTGALGFSLESFGAPGRFEVDAVLERGPNRFTAVATDAAGNSSVASDAIDVELDPSSLGDLAFDGSIRVLPAAPAEGTPATLSVRVRNDGPSATAPSVASFTGVDPSGSLYGIGSVGVPALAPGESTTLSRLWSTSGRLGGQAVVATLDPLEVQDESDETNNVTFIEVMVTGTAGLEVSAAPGRSRYGADEAVEIALSAVNGGTARSVVLETVVEDAAGARVAVVDARTVNLGYADSLRFELFWNTGSVLAGDYRVHLRALEGSAVVASASAAFTVEPSFSLSLDATSDRARYTQGDSARLLTRVAHTSGNTPLRDLTLRYRVLDASQVTRFEAVEALGSLPLELETTNEITWDVGAAEPGLYTLRVDAFEASQAVGSASASLSVEALTELRVSGGLDVPVSVVSSGELAVSYRVKNESPLALDTATVRAELFDVDLAQSVAGAEAPLALAAGETGTGVLLVDTAGLALGKYRVVLSVASSAIATSPTTIFGIPSPPSLNAPAMGEGAPQRLTLSVNNASNPNGDVLSYDFELYLDASLRFLVGSATALPEGANATRWEVPQLLDENRRYYWRARAADRFAASDWMTPAEVLVDSVNDPPDAPTSSFPLDRSEVDTLRPELSVTNARDPEGAALTYAFELYRDPALADPVLQVSDVVEGAGETSLLLAFDLEEDATYYWRSRANDGELDSDWTPELAFRVSTSNHAPSIPVPLTPVTGSVATPAPELVVAPAIDPEGGAVTYHFELDAVPGFDSAALQRSPELSTEGWTPPAPLEENGLYYWRARSSDGSATSAWSETVSFRVDVANEPPSAPTPQAPADGAIVESTTPVLSVVNASDPESDALRYVFEVYADAALATLVARIDAVPEGSGRTLWAVTPRLTDEIRYYWRAFANDGSDDSPPSPVQTFRVNLMNEAPGAPTLVGPPAGAIVADASPVLTVANAVDPDGDVISYVFEVYEDEALTTLVEASPALTEGLAQTEWTMSAALEENALYYWRARASDGALDGPWMDTARFRFSSVNEPPTSPTAFAPLDGAVLDDARPVLTVTNAEDPESDTLRYVFEVYADAALTARVTSSTAVDEGMQHTSWPVDLDLEENGTFYWRASANDGMLDGPTSPAARFTINAVDEPPTAPTLLEPADGATVGFESPRLELANATTPDGAPAEPLRYHFALYADEALTDLIAEDERVDEGTDRTSWAPPVLLDTGDTYFWTARAADARGLVSDWAPPFRFTVELPTSDCPPEWREDFEDVPTGGSPAGWRLETESGHPQFLAVEGKLSRRLVSRSSGRGSLLFEGGAEVFDWRNYGFEGVVQDNVRAKKSERERCDFRSGVWFYARPSVEGTNGYRLELTSPRCKKPEARIVKILDGEHIELARTDLPKSKSGKSAKAGRGEDVRFHVELVNDLLGTSIRAHLTVDDEDAFLDVEDHEAPLDGGAVGVWSDRVVAGWDDFVVREVPGFESGISGDVDGDGVCDGACGPVLTVCLDEGFDEATGLSEAVRALGGDSGHSGPNACGRDHSYWVKKGTGVLFVYTPELEPGAYRLELLVHGGSDEKLQVGLPDGRRVLVQSDSGRDRGEKPFVWSDPIEVTLVGGVHELRIESSSESNAKVHVEGYRLEPLDPRCDP